MTFPNRFHKIGDEILEHPFFVNGEIAISTAFEGKIDEGSIVQHRVQILLELSELVGGEELTGPLVGFVELCHHEDKLNINVWFGKTI